MYALGNVRNIIIPGSVVELKTHIFDGCMLTNAVLEYGVPYISANMFSRCRDMTGIEIADSVAVIGNSAFGRCHS